MYNLMASSSLGMWIILGAFAVLMIVMYYFRSKSAKKQQEERLSKLNQLVPGTKVITIDYTYGTIVEVDETTIVIETGSEEHKGYVRVDKRGIYQIIPEETTVVSDDVVAEENQKVFADDQELNGEVVEEKEENLESLDSEENE